ncbi:MAG TPA: glycosyltransferase family 1 protein, partial [Acidobacteriaceae bacterium]|nr:glycosyltransferase family 1 protein [Acidobacteriaceae bacterium]
MMRVLYDHQAFSLQSHGGITRVFSEVVSYLNRQPDVSTTVLLGFSNTLADFRPIVSPRGRVFHPGRGLFRNGILNYAVNEAITNASAPFLGRFDVYHSTLYRFAPMVRAVRRVTTHHDCVQERFPELFPDRDRIIRSKRRMFAQADLILCVSEASRADLLHFYDIPPERTTVVHNGVSAMRRSPGGEAALRAHVAGEYLLYVGARHAYKNFDGLLRAYAESGLAETCSLLVLGGGAPSSAEFSLIEKFGLPGRVRFVPHAAPELLAEAYARATLLVYPSLYEGFGMPPLEAASAGCASLVASNPATREVCQDSVFYFDPADHTDFSRMLGVAVSDANARARQLCRSQGL